MDIGVITVLSIRSFCYNPANNTDGSYRETTFKSEGNCGAEGYEHGDGDGAGEWLANAFSAWPAHRWFQRERFYTSLTAFVLSTDSSCSCSVSSGSRNGWKAP